MLRRLLLALPAAMAFAAKTRAEDDPLAALRRPGSVGLLRHARAPGTGDPAGFRLDDCSTQRNLDAAGREQARRIGARLRAGGLDLQVFSSQWCRTRETASLLGMSPAESLPALNSFFGDSAAGVEQTAALRRFIADWRGKPLLLVTHQVNITALTGVFPGDGELVVLGPGPDGPRVVARIPGP